MKDPEIYTYYYEVDEHGEPDLDRPIPVSKDQFIADHLRNADSDPESLADLYTDFYNFGGIEFLVFKGRLSSAVLISRYAQRAITEVEARLKASRDDGSYIVPGWEAESGDVLSSNLGTVEDAYSIALGSTIVTAVAALESLLIDLTLDTEARRQGLARLLQEFLRRHDVSGDQARALTEMGRKVGKRRNTFAHTLTGSYFERDRSVAAMFTSGAMEDTLHTVGAIAVAMEQITIAHSPD